MNSSNRLIDTKFIESHKISIIMGIYNCENTLIDAINSILSQSYYNWELIMCDDGSKDGTYQLAKKIVDAYPKKMLLISNNNNMGLNYTLKKCLKYANGKYIARMDADDKCSSNRLMREIEVLYTEKNIDFVSTGMTYFDEKGVWGKILKKEYPQKLDFLYESPFCHASCLIKKQVFDDVNGYTVSKNLLRVEDYHLWLKIYIAGYKGKNIQEFLYSMRDDRNAYKRRKLRYRLNESYVKILAIRKLQLPFYGYIYVLKPIIIGLLPYRVYKLFHKKRLGE